MYPSIQGYGTNKNRKKHEIVSKWITVHESPQKSHFDSIMFLPLLNPTFAFKKKKKGT
jgi:hypothetical protein